MSCDELGFHNLREVLFLKEKSRKMLPRVMKRSLDSCLSYVFMTDVCRKLSLTLGLACMVRISSERIKEVFELGI